MNAISTSKSAGLICAFLMLFRGHVLADSTFVYAVQLSATVQSAPPQIALHWEPDPYGANSYTVYRKSEAATDWGAAIASLPGSATGFTDTQVTDGGAYEYQVVKAATLGYHGYGYIYSGINVPLIENRGTLVLVVEASVAGPLSAELSRLRADLLGDGWQVLTHEVSSNDSPAEVRSIIRSDYLADPAHVKAVFLFGHVPVLHSGDLSYDSHGFRAMPADAYYGDMDEDWPTDPATSPSFLPSDVELMVGRVDLANMPGVGAAVPWPSETELLRNYLNKEHAWRNKLIAVPPRALMANRVGDNNGEAVAASGYRAFDALVGPGQTSEADVEDSAPADERWISLLANNTYLWTYACSGGDANALGWLGTNPPYQLVFSTDIVGQDAHAVFAAFFGSWLGGWDQPDNMLRAVLATPSIGLAACMAGRPHWFFHHTGLGEPIGYSTRLSMNNSTLYRNETNAFTRAVYVALMGDPSLRLYPVGPPPAVSGTTAGGTVSLTWVPSPDTVAGYYVYRAASPEGPFARLTQLLLPAGATSFADNTAAAGPNTYMVRAVKLEVTPSGSFYDPSEGAFVTVTATGSPSFKLSATAGGGGIVLSWNSEPGATYHVEARVDLSSDNWSDASGPIVSNSSTLSWTDTNTSSSRVRFYRVASP